jgi:hypothetical protein
MTIDDRRRTAIHEAGHALARWRFGWPIECVSIRPGVAHAGLVMGLAPVANLSKKIGGRHPLDGLDPALRRLADQGMVISAIGEVAADLLVPRMGRLAEPPVHKLPPARLSPSVQAKLVAAEAMTAPPTDADVAFEMAFGLVGMAAQPYLAWIRAEANRIAATDAAFIQELAQQLLAREVIDGASAVAILEAAEAAQINAPETV